MTSQQILAKLTMKILPLRFTWFTMKSWRYMQGDRVTYFRGFWLAWRQFNRSVKHDLNCEGCCEDD